MTNQEMKPNRFLRWHNARTLHRRIAEHIAAGGRVVIGTYLGSVIYRSADHFVCGRTGLFVRRGRSLDLLTGYDGRPLVGIRFAR
jgi:hypothetical protein